MIKSHQKVHHMFLIEYAKVKIMFCKHETKAGMFSKQTEIHDIP